jgi:hypothetical protein
MKDGYVRDAPIPDPVSSSTLTADVTIAHIDQYRLIVPATIAVGESVRLEARVVLDDGSTSTGFLYDRLSVDDDAVLNVQPTGWITGMAPGTSTITRYYGATTTDRVRVSN